MKRLLQSSTFWNAVIAVGMIILVCKIGCTGEGFLSIPEIILILFGGKQVHTTLKDYVRAKSGVEYDKDSKTFKKVE